MQFEYIGGSSRHSQYSLYDDNLHANNPLDTCVMSIEINNQTSEWWFVSVSNLMSKEHMIALYNFLNERVGEKHV